MREPIDLAGERLRGYVLAANDEFFGGRENLIKHEEPVARPNQFTYRGRAVDGWQTRRRRHPGHDWAVVRLGAPGVVEEVVVDTAHFTDSHPVEVSLEGCVAPHNSPVEELGDWTELVPPSNVGGDRENRFEVHNRCRFTHVRLNIFPDGGVARLRVHGQPVPGWMAPGFRHTGAMDLAALVNGGHVHSASDMEYGDRQNLIKPGDCLRMDHGWETRRRRGSGHDWAVIRLVGPGTVQALTLDTSHFLGNCPAQAQVEASSAGDPGEDDWFELLPTQTMLPHTRHDFQEELADNADVLWVRLNIFPDGGMARFRVWGELSEAGFTQARLLYLNSSRKAALQSIFKQVCHSDRWVNEITQAAPFFSLNDLLKKGATAWSKCEERDWRQALEGHPRIGEKAKGGSLSSHWSRGEQSRATTVDPEVARRLREAQAAYYTKFGFIFLICATGRSSEEILKAVEGRLENSVAEEMQTVAEEQAKIIHLRLEKLLK